MQAVYQRFRARRRAPLSQRAVAMLLAIGLQLVVILALLRLDDRPLSPSEPDRALSTFSLIPARTPARTATPRPKAVAKRKASASASAAAPSATVPKPSTPEQPPPPVNPLFGNKALFDGANIAALPAHDEDRASGSSQGSGADSAAAYGPGEGPGGQRLYKADWVREPSDAELRTYMPQGIAKGSTADIACRTIPDQRVDNCRMLAESPLGSGLARGLREAAWQFRIRPPRVGGKAMVGTWVHIHFDFTRDAPGD